MKHPAWFSDRVQHLAAGMVMSLIWLHPHLVTAWLLTSSLQTFSGVGASITFLDLYALYLLTHPMFGTSLVDPRFILNLRSTHLSLSFSHKFLPNLDSIIL